MARVGYTPDQVRRMSTEELLLVDHHKSQQEVEFLERIGKFLGVLWDHEELEAATSGGSQDGLVDRSLVPLSLVINPKLLENLKKQAVKKSTYIAGGEFVPSPNMEVVSMEHMSKEQFAKIIGKKLPSQRGK